MMGGASFQSAASIAWVVCGHPSLALARMTTLDSLAFL